jgi:enoyl-CoA hydratase/carnithine racemase
MGENGVTLKREGRVAYVGIDHPPVNSLSRNVIEGLDAVFRTIEQEDSLTVVVLTGTGKTFSAGAELKELASARTREETEESLRRAKRLLDRVEALAIPVIGAINGICLGGGLELALACHIRIADENARFGFPEINLGLMPGAGGTQRLARLTGFSSSCELILTGKIIHASEAFNIRMVDQVTPAGACLETAGDIARAIGSKSRAAVISALEAIRSSSGTSVREGMERETRLFGRLVDTAEVKENITVFLARQKA